MSATARIAERLTAVRIALVVMLCATLFLFYSFGTSWFGLFWLTLGVWDLGFLVWHLWDTKKNFEQAKQLELMANEEPVLFTVQWVY
jgi:hypothetical protein